MFWLGTLAGNYIGLSCALFLYVGGSVATVDEGIQLLVDGAFGLPMSLTLIRICGAELLTANSCFLAIAVFEVRTLARLHIRRSVVKLLAAASTCKCSWQLPASQQPHESPAHHLAD